MHHAVILCQWRLLQPSQYLPALYTPPGAPGRRRQARACCFDRTNMSVSVLVDRPALHLSAPLPGSALPTLDFHTHQR